MHWFEILSMNTFYQLYVFVLLTGSGLHHGFSFANPITTTTAPTTTRQPTTPGTNTLTTSVTDMTTLEGVICDDSNGSIPSHNRTHLYETLGRRIQTLRDVTSATQGRLRTSYGFVGNRRHSSRVVPGIPNSNDLVGIRVRRQMSAQEILRLHHANLISYKHGIDMVYEEARSRNSTNEEVLFRIYDRIMRDVLHSIEKLMRKERMGTFLEYCVEAIDFSLNSDDPDDRNNRNLYIVQELNNYIPYAQRDFNRLRSLAA